MKNKMRKTHKIMERALEREEKRRMKRVRKGREIARRAMERGAAAAASRLGVR